MFVSDIHLNNFRNYKSFDLCFSDGVTVLYGKNGLGKTNILEAVFLTVIGKSFRNSKDADLIRYGEQEFNINLSIKEDITENISIKYEKNREKYIKVNGFYLRKMGHLMGNVIAVIFSPEDLQLITEGPAERRKFMDIAISQLYPSYYFDLLQYNKIIAQKNSLLKNVKYQNSASNREMIDLWNDQLSEAGSKIIYKRYEFINEICKIASEKNKIISGKETLKMQYDSGTFTSEEMGDVDFTNKEEICRKMKKYLLQKMDKEIERESAYIGPHRDDIIFKLEENDIKRFGSQGQKRTAVLSLKMSELELLKKKTGRKPIFLLDDVLSELDINRQRSLINELTNIQTLITCTHIEDTIKDISSFKAIELEKLIEKNPLQ